jgi:PilZ domain
VFNPGKGIRMSDKRRSARVKPESLGARTGKILIPGSNAPIECRVVDISAGGACLELTSLIALPKRVEFLHCGVRKVCTLVWTRGYRLGLQYEAPIQRSLAGSGLSRVKDEASPLARARR